MLNNQKGILVVEDDASIQKFNYNYLTGKCLSL